MNPAIRRALISVSDKQGVLELAQRLAARGVVIYSTGGTRKHLQAGGVETVEVSAYTGFPEMLDGRLKTLHPKLYGGILARRDRPDDLAALGEHQIDTLELVVVNLYPFEATIARPGVTDAEAVEQIDIGGPTLVRAAAKNHAFTTIACQPSQYAAILAEFDRDGCTSLELRRRLAGDAYAHTAAYDAAISAYFAQTAGEKFPAKLSVALSRSAELRYGENSHQAAAVYRLKRLLWSKPGGGPAVERKRVVVQQLA
jgi:phosphoribosylaminoimidazolecarboxamide formyltransferase/IMP cyclohydrolase